RHQVERSGNVNLLTGPHVLALGPDAPDDDPAAGVGEPGQRLAPSLLRRLIEELPGPLALKDFALLPAGGHEAPQQVDGGGVSPDRLEEFPGPQRRACHAYAPSGVDPTSMGRRD